MSGATDAAGETRGCSGLAITASTWRWLVLDARGEVFSAYVAALSRRPQIDGQTLSVRQLAELLGFEPERFIGLQVNLQRKTVTLFLDPKDADATTGP